MADNPWAETGSGGNRMGGGGGGGGSQNLSKKFEKGFEKTKEVASIGYKKVKKGASVSVNWLKIKYRNYKLNSKK